MLCCYVRDVLVGDVTCVVRENVRAPQDPVMNRSNVSLMNRWSEAASSYLEMYALG